MAKLEKLKPGQVLFTVTKSRLGNTTLRTVHIHEVVVREVHENHVVASWNWNAPRPFYRGEVASWKLKRPETVKGMWGAQRLKTKRDREEEAKAREPQGDADK